MHPSFNAYRSLLICSIAVLAYSFSYSQSTHWTGHGEDGQWNDPENWTDGVPDKDVNAVFRIDAHITSPAHISCRELDIDRGAEFILGSGIKLTVHDNVEMDGLESGFVNYGTLYVPDAGGEDAIEIDGRRIYFKNHGTIRLEGGEDGIDIDSEEGLFSNKGSIIISGFNDSGEEGIDFEGDLITFENGGLIDVYDCRDGIEFDDDECILINFGSGTIRLQHLLDDGINFSNSEDQLNSIHNYGSIHIKDVADEGIDMDGDGSAVTNMVGGHISIIDHQDDGIDLEATGAIFENYGSLFLQTDEVGVYSILNTQSFYNFENATVEILGSGEEGIAAIESSGVILNEGIWKVTADLALLNAAVVLNDNCGTMFIHGSLINASVLVNNGYLRYEGNAPLENTGVFQNSGFFVNLAGPITGGGVFQNNGEIGPSISLETSDLVCNDQVTVSVGMGCAHALTLDDVLENAPPYDSICFAFKISVAYPPGYENVPEQYSGHNVVTGEMRGLDITYKVEDLFSSNSCWGTLRVEDKRPPDFIRFEDREISCFDAWDLRPPHAFDNCSPAEVILVEETFDDYSCDSADVNISGRISRTYLARDIWGNTKTQTQVLTLILPDLDSIHFPRDTVIECMELDTSLAYLNKGYYVPKPIQFGQVESPYFLRDVQLEEDDEDGPREADKIYVREEGSPYCDIYATYKDHIIPTCGHAYKVRREWKVVNWCTNEEMTAVQWIEIVDDRGPEVGFGNTTVSPLKPHECKALVDHYLARGDCGMLGSYW